MDRQALSALVEKKIELGSEDLKDFKQTHLHLLNQEGLKSSGEFYKFTNMDRFIESFEYSPQNNEIDLTKFEISSMPTILFMDGELFKSDLNIPGLKISKLKDEFTAIASELTEKNALTHLHHSLLEEGIVLSLEKNTELKTPVRILHIFSKSSICAPTIFVRAAKFSKMTLIESAVGLNDSYCQIAETYLSLEEGAKVEHIQIDEGKNQGLHHESTYAKVQKDGSYKNIVFHIGGKLIRRNLDLKLLDPGANGESYNLFLTEDGEHSDINTVTHHMAPDTTSNQLAKSILDGDSKGIFTGKIYIHPKAQRVVSGQLNKNLLLSKKAQVHSQPQLEIFADDVKCSHGSTTGQLSDDEIFYFETRGIPADRAKTILAHGFGMEVALKIENKMAQAMISAIILEKLKTKFNI